MERRAFLALLASAPMAANQRQLQSLNRDVEQNFDVFAVEGSHVPELVPWRTDIDRAVPLRNTAHGPVNALNGRRYVGTLRCKGTPLFWMAQ